MRVLHVFKTYLPDSFGGIERTIWELAEGAAARGVEVDVLSLSRTPPTGPQRIGQHTAHHAHLDLYLASTGFSLSAFGRFRELARRADVVHYHFPWPFMDVLRLAGGVNRPSVVTYHSDIVRQRLLAIGYAPLMHAFLARAGAIVATSPDYAKSSPVLQRHMQRVTVIPIGLDESAVARPTDAERAAILSRVPERFFLFVGALRYYKGLGYLLAAARETGLPVVVAGTGEMQPEVEQANLPNLVALGQVTDAEKTALLERATAFVFPSHLRSEAFGVALLEAAMTGRPMISCAIGTGTSYINVDGETGLVVPPADVGALSAAMRRIWAHPEESEAMGRAARQRYEQLFRADRMIDDYVALYRRVAGRPA